MCDMMGKIREKTETLIDISASTLLRYETHFKVGCALSSLDDLVIHKGCWMAIFQTVFTMFCLDHIVFNLCIFIHKTYSEKH